MNYRHKLQYFLVKKLGISHAQAKLLIVQGEVTVDGLQVRDNIPVTAYSSIFIGHQCLQEAESFKYFLYHKPAGVECTLNPLIADNLLQHLPPQLHDCYPAGRLDKASEGLLLLLNDGKLLNRIIEPRHKIEKEYNVWLESAVTEALLQGLQKGVELKKGTTLPCTAIQTGSHTIRMVLTEGKNRQIRRMVFSLDNYVTRLQRVRIDRFTLENLPSGSFRPLNTKEILLLRNL